MKTYAFVVLLAVGLSAIIVFGLNSAPIPVQSTRNDPVICDDCGDTKENPSRASLLLSPTPTPGGKETSHVMDKSKEEDVSSVSWYQCRQCPSVSQQKGRKVPTVCQGTPGNMTMVPGLSLLQDMASQECESICACPQCETCGVEARPFPTTVQMGKHVVKHFTGNSGYMLLLFNDSHSTTYVAKLGRDKRVKVDRTSESKLIAQQKIRDECGFQDIVPREQIGPIKAHIASELSNQTHVSAEQVIFSEYFQGLEVARGNPKSYRSVNGTTLVLAALHDYLLGIRRTIHNGLVLPDNNLKLIDNHADCLLDFGNSIFVPGTPFWFEQKSWVKHLDYRCRNSSRTLNTNYPPSIWRCLKSMTSLTVEDLATKYDIFQSKASSLHQRATWMMHGFEYAIARSLNMINGNEDLTNFTLPSTSCD